MDANVNFAERAGDVERAIEFFNDIGIRSDPPRVRKFSEAFSYLAQHFFDVPGLKYQSWSEKAVYELVSF